MLLLNPTVMLLNLSVIIPMSSNAADTHNKTAILEPWRGYCEGLDEPPNRTGIEYDGGDSSMVVALNCLAILMMIRRPNQEALKR